MEQRQSARFRYEVRAAIRHDSGVASCMIVDLSLRGIYVRASAGVAVGDTVEVGFSVGGKSAPTLVRCPGRVVRRDDDGLGIQFKQADPESLEALKNIVALHGGRTDEITEEFQQRLEQLSPSAAP